MSPSTPTRSSGSSSSSPPRAETKADRARRRDRACRRRGDLRVLRARLPLRDDCRGARDALLDVARTADRHPRPLPRHRRARAPGRQQDQERHAARPRAGDPGGEADHGCDEEQWQVRDARRSRSGSRSRPSATSSSAPSSSSAAVSQKRPTSRAKLRANLPVVAAGALGVGFLLAGGIGARMRLLARRGREGHTKSRFGRFPLSTATEPRPPKAGSIRPRAPAAAATGSRFQAHVQGVPGRRRMGLSQQIAFSSLLAFFPSIVLLVALLGLVDAYDDLADLPLPRGAGGGHRHHRAHPERPGRAAPRRSRCPRRLRRRLGRQAAR